MAKIIVIAINKDSFFDEIHANLMATIQQKAQVIYVRDVQKIASLLAEQPRPTTVLITDAIITTAKNARTWGAIINYMRQGGTAVAMGRFSSFVKLDDTKPFFNQAGLDWDRGAYHRTTLALNQDAVTFAVGSTLLPEYSQKALFVKNVQQQDMWYQSTGDSVTESHVFAEEAAHKSDQTAVAFTKVGDGRFGYIGDVNSEEGSDAVVLAMCNLHK